MKSTKMKNLISYSEYDPDTLFIIVIIEENQSEKLGSSEIKEGISSMPVDEFLNFFDWVEKNAVWELFRMNNLVSKGKETKKSELRKNMLSSQKLWLDQKLRKQSTTNLLTQKKIINLRKRQKLSEWEASISRE